MKKIEKLRDTSLDIMKKDKELKVKSTYIIFKSIEGA